MNTSRVMVRACITLTFIASTTVHASQDTIGVNGINSAGLTDASPQHNPLNGAGVGIGQVEKERPADFDRGDDALHANVTIDPFVEFVRGQTIPPPAYNGPLNADYSHAEWVAGVMISTDAVRTGVATSAWLYSAGYKPNTNFDAEAASMAEVIATQVTPNGDHVRAINFSFHNPIDFQLDGNQLLTEFIDWSASRHDILYVAAGRENATPASNGVPVDNFNGITVGASEKSGNVYSLVSSINNFNVPIASSDPGPRTAIDLIAPGYNVDMEGPDTTVASDAANDGTSFAAPHVTAAVALLQQYANERIMNAGWSPTHSRRHEVMKAVLLNSADKIKDDGLTPVNGTLVPKGGFLGMEKTILDNGPNHDGLNRQNWLQSEAYGDFPTADATYIPFDDQMGAGQLNVKRAIQQFAPGEYHSDGAAVPAIGWDYGHTTGVNATNKYAIAPDLMGKGFISITLAFDRQVTINDLNGNNQYDFGETFQASADASPDNDDLINDLDVYLLPAGATDTSEAIAESISGNSTIEHLFFQIPADGHYEIWVNQFDQEPGLPQGQNYAIAWWAATALTSTNQGDYNHDGIVDATDYTAWKNAFGSANADADGNGNGIVDAADYTVWRDHLGQHVGGSAAAVPEPASVVGLALLGSITLVGRLRRNC